MLFCRQLSFSKITYLCTYNTGMVVNNFHRAKTARTILIEACYKYFCNKINITILSGKCFVSSRYSRS